MAAEAERAAVPNAEASAASAPEVLTGQQDVVMEGVQEGKLDEGTQDKEEAQSRPRLRRSKETLQTRMSWMSLKPGPQAVLALRRQNTGFADWYRSVAPADARRAFLTRSGVAMWDIDARGWKDR